MANEQATVLSAGAVDPPGQTGSVLTGDPNATAGTPPSAASTTTKEPPKWMAQLSPDLQSDESLTKFGTITELGKSYKELEGKLSNVVILPGEDASEEDRAKFYQQIGRPEKPEDYKLDKPELPKGFEYDEDIEKNLRDIAHKNGMTNAQINAVNQLYTSTLAQQIINARKIVKTTTAEAEAQLRKEMGADFDAATGHMERAFKQFFNEPGVAELFVTTGIGNHPGVIKGFIALGKAIAEHPFVDGSRGEHTDTGKVGERTFEQIADSIYGKKNQQ